MYTQCSKCETVFRLSAEVLRAAGGQVRCGRCGELFNALARLAEDAGEFPKGESPLELESRADAILHTAVPEAPAQSEPQDDRDIAQLRILDEPMDDTSLEFTLPPGELDRIFVETSPSPLQLLTAAVKVVAAETTSSASAAAASAAAAPVTSAPAVVAVPAVVAPAVAAAVVVAPPPPPVVPGPIAPVARLTGLEISDRVRRDVLAGFGAPGELEPELDFDLPRRGLPASAWVSAAVVLTILLAVQVIRTDGAWLSARATFSGGEPSAAALSAYQLRQWGVSGDPAAKGTLRVRASIMNTAAQLQPYPLLRVTLADRFGKRIGERLFEPGEYLGKSPARMLTPGEPVDAVLDILDPGKEAEGFEIDVCVRGANKKVACAGDAAAQPK